MVNETLPVGFAMLPNDRASELARKEVLSLKAENGLLVVMAGMPKPLADQTQEMQLAVSR